jgi:hypothetical protein
MTAHWRSTLVVQSRGVNWGSEQSVHSHSGTPFQFFFKGVQAVKEANFSPPPGQHLWLAVIDCDDGYIDSDALANSQ